MNVRKAQKHMQRAKELLNQEGQLGFGTGPNQLPLHKLSDDIRTNVASGLGCQHTCMLAAASTSDRKLLKEKCILCQEVNKAIKSAREGRVRLRSYNMIPNIFDRKAGEERKLLSTDLEKTLENPNFVGSKSFANPSPSLSKQQQQRNVYKIDVTIEVDDVTITKKDIIIMAIFTINQDRYLYNLGIEKLENCEVWICNDLPLYAMLELDYIIRLAEESKVLTKVTDNRGDASTRYKNTGLYTLPYLQREAIFPFLLQGVY